MDPIVFCNNCRMICHQKNHRKQNINLCEKQDEINIQLLINGFVNFQEDLAIDRIDSVMRGLRNQLLQIKDHSIMENPFDQSNQLLQYFYFNKQNNLKMDLQKLLNDSKFDSKMEQAIHNYDFLKYLNILKNNTESSESFIMSEPSVETIYQSPKIKRKATENDDQKENLRQILQIQHEYQILVSGQKHCSSDDSDIKEILQIYENHQENQKRKNLLRLIQDQDGIQFKPYWGPNSIKKESGESLQSKSERQKQFLQKQANLLQQQEPKSAEYNGQTDTEHDQKQEENDLQNLKLQIPSGRCIVKIYKPPKCKNKKAMKPKLIKPIKNEDENRGVYQGRLRNKKLRNYAEWSSSLILNDKKFEKQKKIRKSKRK